MQQSDYRPEMQACAEAIELNPPAIVLPEDRWVTLGGLRFHCLDWGNDHLPHLVLLHGGSLTAHTWDMAALLLREHFHVVALDQRGHGDSVWTPPEQRDTDVYVLLDADLAAFINHLGYERVVLGGMSMGGLAAIRYAARQPERLSGLIIVDIAPTMGQEGALRLEELRNNIDLLGSFEEFFERAVRANPRRHPAHLRYSLMHSLRPTEEGWTWKQEYRPRPQLGEEEARKEREENTRRTEAMWDDVRAVRAPALVLRGAYSKVLTPEGAQRLAETIPDCTVVVVDNARHSVQGDNPRGLAEAIIAWQDARL
jgi:pimeloyl-ACP methyl ester carboxylesterase